MDYQTFTYIYPPRAEVKTLPLDLKKYQKDEYLAQPKYNGTCAVVFTNGTDLYLYNRHKEPLSRYSPDIEFFKLAKTDKWFAFAGEYLNKGKLGEHGTKEENKFVIWDVLVWDGVYLLGHTLENRLLLLEKYFPCERARVTRTGIEIYEHLCGTNLKGIYKAPTYQCSDLHNLYTELAKTDLYEGLVLKKKASRLKLGMQSKNNDEWQIKCRKETKNYKF